MSCCRALGLKSCIGRTEGAISETDGKIQRIAQNPPDTRAGPLLVHSTLEIERVAEFSNLHDLVYQK